MRATRNFRQHAAALLTAVLSAVCCGSAQAGDLSSLIVVGQNSASNENRQYLIDRVRNVDFWGAELPAGSPPTVGQIDVGDSLRGMIGITTLNSTGANVGGLTGHNEWTGVFQLQVVEKTDLLDGRFLFRFAPDPAFASSLCGGVSACTATQPGMAAIVPGPGAMIVMFEGGTAGGGNNFATDFSDPAPATPPSGPDDGTPGSPSPADLSSGPYATEEAFIARATDGARFWTLGFTGGVPDGIGSPLAGPGEGFAAISWSDNVLLALMSTPGWNFALLNGSLNRVANLVWERGDAINLGTLDTVFAAVGGGGFCMLPSIPCGTAQVALSGNTRGVFGLDTAFEASSTLDTSFTVRPCDGRIGDFVWHDLNRNGIQDAGEPGLAGVRVILKGEIGNLLREAVTDAGGLYLFTGLCAGAYVVEVDATTVPAGFIPSLDDQGVDDTVDSDGRPEPATLATDTTVNLTIDFGYNTPCDGRIGDVVWHDLNRDGIQGAGEPGTVGVRVILKDGRGNFITDTVTGAGGLYLFTGLCAGAYVVEVDATTVPAGFVVTPENRGGDDTKDSDGSPEPLTLPTDTTANLTVDFGYNTPCTGQIGDVVRHDLNGNGIQDAGEPGLPNVLVILRDAAGTILQMDVTDANGLYLFTGLCAGAYVVEVDATTVPANFVPALENRGGDDTKDSDGSPEPVTLPGDNTVNLTVDFGFVRRDICLVIIDKDGIDDEIQTIEAAASAHRVTPEFLVNDDRPTKVGNPPLRWNELFPGDVVKLPAGEADGAGWFALPPPPAIRYADSRTTNLTYQEWLAAFVAGTLPEDKLDKVRDVMPLRNQDLVKLVGRTCVAVAYDSHVSIGYRPLYANLQGARYGLFSFTVLAVEVPGSIPESDSSRSLYDLWVRVEPPLEPTGPFLVPIRDHGPEWIQITRARYRNGTLTVRAMSSFAPTSIMTVSVDGADRGNDPAVPPFILEAPMSFNSATKEYEFVLATPVNLAGRRVTVQTNEGGADNSTISQ